MVASLIQTMAFARAGERGTASGCLAPVMPVRAEWRGGQSAPLERIRFRRRESTWSLLPLAAWTAQVNLDGVEQDTQIQPERHVLDVEEVVVHLFGLLL